MIALKQILVATDFSGPAEVALAYGRDLAREYGATLHLLFVENDLVARYALDSSPMFTVDTQRDLEKAAQERLDALVTVEDRRQLHARATVRVSLSPAVEIVDYAKRHDIDLIVLGTHGRGALAQLLLGSVAERVVRTATCPVLTVHHPPLAVTVPDPIPTTATI